MLRSTSTPSPQPSSRSSSSPAPISLRSTRCATCWSHGSPRSGSCCLATATRRNGIPRSTRRSPASSTALKPRGKAEASALSQKRLCASSLVGLPLGDAAPDPRVAELYDLEQVDDVDREREREEGDRDHEHRLPRVPDTAVAKRDETRGEGR